MKVIIERRDGEAIELDASKVRNIRVDISPDSKSYLSITPKTDSFWYFEHQGGVDLSIHGPTDEHALMNPKASNSWTATSVLVAPRHPEQCGYWRHDREGRQQVCIVRQRRHGGEHIWSYLDDLEANG